MSDSHNQHRRLPAPVPDGDVFIHAGDFGCSGKESDVRDFGAWVRSLPHPHKIIIAGNHDASHQRQPEDARRWIGDGFTYLEESGHTVDGVRFWGSPWTPAHNDWAFNYRPEDGDARWARIPAGIDVLITHGPPHGILDHSSGKRAERGESIGCNALRAAVERIGPRVHIFGHIHNNPGCVTLGPTRFFNVAVVDDPGNKMARGCTVIDL